MRGERYWLTQGLAPAELRLAVSAVNMNMHPRFLAGEEEKAIAFFSKYGWAHRIIMIAQDGLGIAQPIDASDPELPEGLMCCTTTVRLNPEQIQLIARVALAGVVAAA